MMRQGRRHFTFLELMIATTITMLIALGLYGFSQGVTSSWVQMIAKRDQLSARLALDRVVDGVLSNIVPFVWQDDEGQEFPFIVGDIYGLRVAYLHPLHDPDEGALRFAEFFVEDGTLWLKYTDRPFFDWEDVGDRFHVARLADKVDSIEFRYADWNDDTDADWKDRLLWLEEWETTDSERMDAPLAVAMTIHWQDGTDECYLRRTMGNSYRERYGKWEPLSEDKR